MKASLTVQRTGKSSSSNKSAVIAQQEELRKILQQNFGHANFRGQQLEAIQAVLSGQDCFCLMPTGGGKSLCYQIPALAKDGVVLVVSPLIALMENQVATLKSQHICAEFLSSAQHASARAQIYEELNSGNPSLRILYVTPELIATGGFLSKLKKLYDRGRLSLIAIDEAHCISSWGHDFRPSYRQLSTLRSGFPNVPILALTATAAKKVQEDIVRSLKLYQPRILISSFNRPNIYYEVRYKDLLKNTYEDLRDLLKSDPRSCAIVYCHTRNTCDEIGARLQADGISSRVYHAGLADKVRSQALDDWSSGKVPVIVGTVAFGMGIDRRDVRLVCHYNIPKSIESFYQESGRAGRDNKHSKSILYYGLDDRRSMEFIMRNSPKKKRKQSGMEDDALKKGLRDFEEMVAYCDLPGCRRQKLLGHFGEQVSATLCGQTCDSCRHPARVADVLQQLSETASMRCSYKANVFISSNGKECREFKSEFWNYSDEDGNDPEDDICNSDDEATDIAEAVTREHRYSDKKLDSKFESLLRAEKEYNSRQGENSGKSKTNEKNMVSQSLREMAMQKLQKAVEQALQRTQASNFDDKAIFVALEEECFKKYGKSGRSFYNSQVASTLRWLSSCTLSELEARAPKQIIKEPEDLKTINTGIEPNTEPQANINGLGKKRIIDNAPEKPPHTVKLEGANDLLKGKTSAAEAERQNLPSIPSFSAFMSKKLKSNK